MDAEDRISALPDSLIHHILSFLPMGEVIRTSVLSSRWRNLWASVPSLDFSWDKEGEEDSDSEEAAMFICHTLMRYRVPKIQKFRLHFNFTPSCEWNVDSWVHFAVAHDVEEFEMNLIVDQWDEINDDGFDTYTILTESSSYLYVMPNLLFNCQALIVLRLAFCEVKFGAPLCLCSLKVLELNRVGLNDLDTSGCPLLENIILCKCGSIGNLMIFAPNQNLKYLKIDNFFSKSDLTIDAPHLLFIDISGNFFGDYKIKDASSIRKAGLEFKVNVSGETANIMNLLEILSHASSIKLCGTCLQVIFTSEKNFNKVLPVRASALELDNGLTKYDLPGMAYLLRSSQNIAFLTLNIISQEDSDLVLPQGSKYWKILELALSSSLNLKHVKINNFLSSACIPDARFTGGPKLIIKRLLKDCETEIKLVILILQKCKMLKELQIFCVRDARFHRLSFWSDVIQIMQSTLLGFQKASADVQICIS